MSSSGKPKTGYETLEEIVNTIPYPPTRIEFKLFGHFDYNDPSRQVNELVPGLGDIKLYDNQTCEVKEPSKLKLLGIYKHSLSRFDASERDWKRLELVRALWRLYHIAIELTPYKLTISYFGDEPFYVSELRKKLSSKNFGLIISSNVE